MAVVEHRTATDPDIHEPRDITAAALGAVYVADGEGSGKWEPQAGATLNTVIIETEDDFPPPTLGVITLVANTDYFVTGNIVTSSRFLLQENTLIRGVDASISGINYVGTDTMWTSVDASNKVTKILLTCTLGTLVNISSTVPFKVFQLIDVVVPSCNIIGTIDGMFASSFDSVSFPGVVTNGLTFTGTHTFFFAFSNLYSLTLGSAFDFGTATFDSVSIDNVAITLTAAATFVTGATASANINASGLGSIVNTRVLGTGTALSGISADDARWQFALNDNIKDTRPDALLSFTSSATTTIASAGVPVLMGGTWTLDSSSQMDVTAAGRATYKGVKNSPLSMTVGLSIEPFSGTNKNLAAYIAINGVVVQNSGRLVNVGSSDPKSITVIWEATLATDDFIEVFVENQTDTIDIIVNDVVFRVN